MSKTIKVIDTSMSKKQALSVLQRHGLYAENYTVPQYVDSELNEAIRLISGFGGIIKRCIDNQIMGETVRLELNIQVIIQDNKVVCVDFKRQCRQKYPMRDAVSGHHIR